MFDWEGRILDNKSIMMVKAALPFLDLPVGNLVDIEGLLRAVRGFCQQREQRMIDMILNFFMMKRMISIMNMMNQTQNQEQGMEGMLDLIRSQIPKEQQDMFEMMSMMMSMSEMGADGTEESEPDADGLRTGNPRADEAKEGKPAASGMEPNADDERTKYFEPEEQPIPEIWQRIAENIGEETGYGRSE